jgi:23S rRNA (uracil1939-C5)-methyltransferase
MTKPGGEGTLQFLVGPKSFYQTNSEQAYHLYKIAWEMAELKESDVVYDLYTGTGTIANFIAAHCKKVVGLEYVADAIEDAKVNSKINSIANTDFFAGDIKNLLTDDFLGKVGKPDVVITDPPRAPSPQGASTELVAPSWAPWRESNVEKSYKYRKP